MKEFKASGKSGLHFGHMKACTTDEKLAQFETDLANITVKHGLAPTRWETGLNIMLEKKKGDLNVEKLRTIQRRISTC